MFSQQAKRDYNGRNFLSDIRLKLKISAWFEPHGRIRGATNTNSEEIDIDHRAKSRTADFPRLTNGLVPDQDVVNFFSVELEKDRIARPPYAPYVIADSLSAVPWIPTEETHARSLGKWKVNHRTFHRNTGNQDLSLGQFVLYRLRFLLAGDLADAWADYGGIVAQINHLAVVLELSITDHPGIAATYDHRVRRLVQRIAKTRSTRTDYFELLSNLNKDVRTEAIRDFEARTDAQKKDNEKERLGRRRKRKRSRRRRRAAGRKRIRGRAADGGESGRPRIGLPIGKPI